MVSATLLLALLKRLSSVANLLGATRVIIASKDLQIQALRGELLGKNIILNVRKEPLYHMRTVKIQTSLRICTI